MVVFNVDSSYATQKEASLITGPVLDESQQKLRILLAEDNLVNRVLAQKLLQKHGHTVTSANNGREAVQLWEQNQSSQFDVILIDVQMPEMDGLQAAAAIREKEKGTGAHIPIIAVTAHAMKGDRERCLAAGMDGYISKPINPGELAKTIHAIIPARRDPVVAPLDANQEAARDSELLARFDGDAELLKELPGIFLQECPKMLNDIREALRTGDPKGVEHAAHTLKGSVGNFVLVGPRETAQRVESLGKSGQLAGAEEIVRALEQQLAPFNQTLLRNTAETARQLR